MIDKEKLKELIYDNCQSGTYEEKTFFIVPDWEIIRKANKLQGIIGNDSRVCHNCKQSLDSSGCGSNHLGGHYPPYHTPQDKLKFEQLLSYMESDYPFPVNHEDLENIKMHLELQGMIDNGQLSFIDWQWSLPYSKDIASQIIEWSNKDPEDPLYWINENIKDTLDSVDWGFYDEYSVCINCDTVIRTSPDCYEWTLQGYETEYGLYCEECAQEFTDDCITEIQERIDRNKEPKHYPDIFKLSEDWQEVNHPEYTYHSWESGLHPGQNDSPLKQGRIVRAVKYQGNPVFQIIYRIHPSQFTISWQTYVRIDPDSDITPDSLLDITGRDMDQWLEYFGWMFASHEGRTKYDFATLMSEALKQSGKHGNFNRISVDPENGTINIQTFDSPEDMYK